MVDNPFETFIVPSQRNLPRKLFNRVLADGLSPKEIGKRLYISPKTVESHKYNIMDKRGVTSIVSFTKIAIKKHSIDLCEIC